MSPHTPAGLHRAFDAARFGSSRTLDLRSSLPTAAEALARAEPWLREQQMARATEVLLITGRGQGSHDGIPVVREAVRKLLTTLTRKGVVESVQEHTPGSFVVALASVRKLFESPLRSRAPEAAVAPVQPESLQGLSNNTKAALRALSVRALESLGVPRTDAFVRDEMLRQYGLLADATAGIRRGASEREARLQDMIAAALDAYDDER